MANRLLLTLLALMTGLAAQLSMGEARASQATSMQATAPRAAPTVNAPRAPAGLARLAARRLDSTLVEGAVPVAASRPLTAPAVLAGIDRAHE